MVEAMDTSGRAILLAGTTVMIALLGMFATGVSFLYGLAIASVCAVLATLIASLTVLPAMLSRFGPPGRASPHSPVRSSRWCLPGRGGLRRCGHEAASRSRWREWSRTVQRGRGRWRSSRSP